MQPQALRTVSVETILEMQGTKCQEVRNHMPVCMQQWALPGRTRDDKGEKSCCLPATALAAAKQQYASSGRQCENECRSSCTTCSLIPTGICVNRLCKPNIPHGQLSDSSVMASDVCTLNLGEGCEPS